jgi:formate-dependent nitrite reductase membrane component NrfD
MMVEEILVTTRHNTKIDPSLAIWGWEIPLYLFLGGLTAGIMCFAAYAVLARKETDLPFAHDRFALWAPIILSVGMFALFLDLEHKLYVFRFYTSFQPTSPMSWGAWVLVLVYPLMVLQTLSTLRRGYPTVSAWLERMPLGTGALDLSENIRRPVAVVVIPLAMFLGIYTGVLLSAFSARPFWNTGLLGPLFLVSGLSTAGALALIGARLACERHFFTRTDVTLIAVELTLIALLVINLGTGPAQQLEAMSLITGGKYTVPFWLWFVLPGLLIPITLELFELRGICRFSLTASLLVLYGGFMLRYLTVELGQVSTWTEYGVQFDPQLLIQRLTP